MQTKITPLILLLLIATSCSSNQPSKHLGKKAYSKIINNKGVVIGSAKYTQGSHGVLIDLSVSKLPHGRHGMHFHEVGNCKPHHSFKAAKGHIMVGGRPHGFLNPKGPHAGNLPNLVIDKSGKANIELYTNLVSLHPETKKPALLDENGSTLMIHENQDDHYTQPIGGSGARIACGTIKPLP